MSVHRRSSDLSSAGSLTTIQKPLSKRRARTSVPSSDQEFHHFSEDDLGALHDFAERQGLFWVDGWPVQVVPRSLASERNGSDRGSDTEAVMEFGSRTVSWVKREKMLSWKERQDHRFGLREVNGDVAVETVLKELVDAEKTGKWPTGWWQENVGNRSPALKVTEPSEAFSPAVTRAKSSSNGRGSSNQKEEKRQVTPVPSDSKAPSASQIISTPVSAHRPPITLVKSRRVGSQAVTAPLAVARGPGVARIQRGGDASRKRAPARREEDIEVNKVARRVTSVNTSYTSDRSRRGSTHSNPTKEELTSARDAPKERCKFSAPPFTELSLELPVLNKHDRRSYHIGRDVLLGGDGCIRCDEEVIEDESIWSLLSTREKLRKGKCTIALPKPKLLAPMIPPDMEQVTKNHRQVAVELLEQEGTSRRAARNDVMWVKVTGNPFWLAQRIPADVAESLTNGVGRKGVPDEFCVYYFGTREHAFITPSTATEPLEVGIEKGWHLKYPDRKRFTFGLLEAGIYLSKPRRYPWRWWDSFNLDDPAAADADMVDAQSPCPGLFSCLLEFTGLQDFEEPDALPEVHKLDTSQYKAIRRNVYPPELKPTVSPKGSGACCTCDPKKGDKCAEGCVNRAIFFLCSARDCPVGDNCLNNGFERRQCPLLEKFDTGDRGYGIRTKEAIKSGSFIVEYVGEIISADDCSLRMNASLRAKEENFYFMDLGDGLTIDARESGNLSRFINSSCDPNCGTQKWTDTGTGENRVGIFALVDIAPAEELTYDYNLTRKAMASEFICRCGADRCIAPKDKRKKKAASRSLLGLRVEVFFPLPDAEFYPGTITDSILENGVLHHVVSYDDGEVELVDLETVSWRRKGS